MDLEAIDFPDASFDAVTCRFGVMFCPEPLKAVAEVRRVLKPGGWFALSVWDTPDKSPGQTVVGEALRRFGRPQPMVNYDVPGVYQLAPPDKLDALLREAGFGEVHVESLTIDVEYESVEALWGRALVRPGSLRVQVEDLSEEDVQRLQSLLGEVVAPYTRDGVIHLPTTPLGAAARK